MRRSFGFATIAVLSLGSTGCFIPVNIREPASPAIVGVYRHSDGTPAAGAQVAITPHYDDAACTRTTVQGRTDAAGRFSLEPTFVVEHWLLIIPPVERFGNAYRLCAGPADSLLQVVYYGGVSFGYRSDRQPADSIECLDWQWRGATRVICRGEGDKTIQTGGSWTRGDTSGFYRLIVQGGRWNSPLTGVFLQWIRNTDSTGRQIVLATDSLPIVPRLMEFEDVRLVHLPGRAPCVSLVTRGAVAHALAWSQPTVRAILELGAPGEMHPIASCP